MKLQKLLKKLALPVFALVVVGMLAACSSPSGGSSSGNGGDNNSGGAPALTADTEYVIAFSNSLSADEQDALEAEGFAAGDKFTGAEIEGAKADLLAAGYTYTVSGNTVIITKKTTTNTPSGNENKDKDKEKETTTPGDDSSGTPKDAVYTYEDDDLGTMTIRAKSDGTYTAEYSEEGQTFVVEAGKYELKNGKVITTVEKMYNGQSLVAIPEAYQEFAKKTFVIGPNNVLTVDKSGSSSGSKGEGTSEGGKIPSGDTSTTSIDGIYEGTVAGAGAGSSLFASVEISGKTYSVKLYTSPAKTGGPEKTSSGTIISSQSTAKGMSFSGTGTDHTFTAVPNGNSGWTVTITLFSGSVYSGTMTKGSSTASNPGTTTKPVGDDDEQTSGYPSNLGDDDEEFPFDTSNMYFILYGDNDPEPVPTELVDDVLKGLSAGDYEKDDTKKTITIKNDAAAQTVLSNLTSLMNEMMAAAGYKPMDD